LSPRAEAGGHRRHFLASGSTQWRQDKFRRPRGPAFCRLSPASRGLERWERFRYKADRFGYAFFTKRHAWCCTTRQESSRKK
jgi:hypothetical protein